MSLEDKFKEFCNIKQEIDLQKISFNINKLAIKHRAAIKIAGSLSKAALAFTSSGSKFALINGLFETAKDYASNNLNYHDDMFSEKTGWRRIGINGDGKIINIFKTILDDFDSENYHFQYDPNTFVSVIKYHNHNIVKIEGKHLAEGSTLFKYNYLESNLDDIIKLLINDLILKLNSNFISLSYKINGDIISLNAEYFNSIKSKKSVFYADYIKKCISLGQNRSIIFNGPPGTGKSSLSQSIISSLNLRTLKIRDDVFSGFSFAGLSSLIKLLNIECVIIDDFDQIKETNKLFEFLEFIRKEAKLIIGISNSLKSFHPAILRPGRFDEIITIDSIDEDSVRVILGELAPQYLEKVKMWPIAYINELVIRSKIMDINKLDEQYEELKVRVENAMEILK